jgi:hypothetical protein
VPIVFVPCAVGVAAGVSLPDGNLLMTTAFAIFGFCVGVVGVDRSLIEERFGSVRGGLHFKSQTIANVNPPKFVLEETSSGVGTGGWRDTSRPIHVWFSREALPALLDVHQESGLVSVAIDD